MSTFFRYVVAISLLSIMGCGKDCPNPTSNPNAPLSPITERTPACDTTQLPIVFVHGTLASSDTWAQQVMRFESNGYCGARMFGFDYNSVGTGGGSTISALDAFIDKVLAKTGASKVELVGHSQGGSQSYTYCSVAARAAKVAHYVHIGASSQSKPAGPNGEIPTLNLSSPADAIAGSTTITGGTNVLLSGKDHYQVATCVEAFAEMYKFFKGGKAPTTLQIVAQAQPKVSGRVVVLGDNTPVANATIKCYELDAATGAHISSAAQFTLTSDAQGYFAPIAVKPATHYEFEVKTSDPTDRIIHYYREGFVHNDQLVYLRIIPKSGTGALLTNNLPRDDNQSVVAVFTANQAVINGRDSLLAAGHELSNASLSPASATNIAYFLYDGNKNNISDRTQEAIFAGFPFIAQNDIYFPTSPPGSILLRFNGRNQFVRNLKSNSEGVIVAVFD